MTEITQDAVNIRMADCAGDLLDNAENDLDQANEGIRDAVDGMDWVIYTHRAQEAVKALDSDTAGEAFERLSDMGYTFGDIGSLGELYSKIAFCAFDSLLHAAVKEEHDRRNERAEELAEDLQSHLDDFLGTDGECKAEIDAVVRDFLDMEPEPASDALEAWYRAKAAEWHDEFQGQLAHREEVTAKETDEIA